MTIKNLWETCCLSNTLEMVWKGHIMSVSVIGLRSPHLKNEVSYTDLPWSTYLAWRKLKTTWALVLSKTASRAKPRPIYCRIFWAIVSCESISRYLKGILYLHVSATTSWRCFGSPHVTEKYCWESDQSEHLWDDAGTPLAPRLLFKASMVLRTEPSEPETKPSPMGPIRNRFKMIFMET